VFERGFVEQNMLSRETRWCWSNKTASMHVLKVSSIQELSRVVLVIRNAGSQHTEEIEFTTVRYLIMFRGTPSSR